MFKLFKKHRLLILNLLIIFFMLVLPYFIFQGKIYVGGDDTKLFYSYPEKFLKYIVLFSWYHFSSLGWNNPVQFELPFLFVWIFLNFIIPSKIVISYLAFSTPMIFGYIYAQKFLKELLSKKNKHNLEILTGSLFFILSPIIMINQLFNFLSTVWLLGLIPILSYYFVRYLKFSKFEDIFKAMVLTTFFSIALFSIPWILGFVFTLFPSLLICVFLFKRKEVVNYLKRIILFLIFIGLSQAYWLFGFIMSYVSLTNNSFAAKVVSKDFLDTFTPTVLATAVGTIIYPLLNLFHRQIAFNFGWDLKNVFLSFYDKTFLFNGIYLIILFIAVTNFKKYLDKTERKIFIVFFIAFILSLYLFTANIGPLRDLYLLFKNIPSFVALRNFYDKFALAYIAYYAIVISFSLIIVTRKYVKYRKLLISVFLLVVFLNFTPVNKVVNSPLWETKNTGRAITIPKEYTDFMTDIENKISASNNILSIPFGSSIYTVIKDENSENAYVGSSPVIVFSGINDISGHLSFNFTKEANVVDSIILNKDTDKFNKIMYEHNINYVIVTKNIPEEVKKASWIYDPNMLDKQDSNFLASISGKKIFTSSSGNYEFYSSKNINVLLKSDNLYFQRINPIKYRLYIKNLKGTQALEFIDSFHDGWKLYLKSNPSLLSCSKPEIYERFKTTECISEIKSLEVDDLGFLYQKPIFNNSHTFLDDASNKWIIDEKYIRDNFDNNFYKVNSDGSLDVEMVLYFKPQSYFYLGLIITLVVMLSGATYLLIKRKNEKIS